MKNWIDEEKIVILNKMLKSISFATIEKLYVKLFNLLSIPFTILLINYLRRKVSSKQNRNDQIELVNIYDVLKKR